MTAAASPDPLDAARRLVAAAAATDLDEPALRALAASVARTLPAGAVVTLSGPLGAGKTTFAQGLADGLGVHEPASVTSPTYALVHEYGSPRGVVVHADLYRLADAAALDALGWEELLAAAAVTIVEWPAVAEARLPAARLDLRLTPAPDGVAHRRIAVGA